MVQWQLYEDITVTARWRDRNFAVAAIRFGFILGAFSFLSHVQARHSFTSVIQEKRFNEAN